MFEKKKALADMPQKKMIEETDNTFIANVPYQKDVSVIDASDVGDFIKELNRDEEDGHNNKMSTIDMRARLHPEEISSILIIDMLGELDVLPKGCLSISRRKKRLSVSLHGKGREEAVDVLRPKPEVETKKGFVNRLQGWMMPGRGM